jgi:hypothetical protein
MRQAVSVFLTGKAFSLRENTLVFRRINAVVQTKGDSKNVSGTMACRLLMHSSGQRLAIQNKKTQS